jgi:hypothetical protein
MRVQAAPGFRSFDSRLKPLAHDDSLRRGEFAPHGFISYDPLPTEQQKQKNKAEIGPD